MRSTQLFILVGVFVALGACAPAVGVGDVAPSCPSGDCEGYSLQEAPEENGFDKGSNGISCSNTAAILEAAPDYAKRIIQRAAPWIDEPTPYSQDWDYARGSHRSDCSGFVSAAWGRDGCMTVAKIGQYTSDISWDQLRPGDAVVSSSHIKLYVGQGCYWEYTWGPMNFFGYWSAAWTTSRSPDQSDYRPVRNSGRTWHTCN